MTNEEKKQKRKESDKRYREKNKDKIQKRNLEYRENNKEYAKEYYENNIDTILKQKKIYYEDNKDEIIANNIQYYENNKEVIKDKKHRYYIKNKDVIQNKLKIYRESHKHEKNRYERNRRNTDSYYRMICNIRSRTTAFIKKLNISKTKSTIKMLGCSKNTLMDHLQQTGILYDSDFDIYNYDSSIYHVDHKKTFEDVSKGIYTLEEVCHYTNLQILPAEINLAKGGNSW